MRNAHNILAGKLEQTIPLGKCRQKWEDNTTTDLKKEGVEWIHVTEVWSYYHAHVNMAMNLLVL
jgi:hypothetical protein